MQNNKGAPPPTLYYSPGACSLAIHALLCSLAQPYRLVCVDTMPGGHRGQDYLELNPWGQVPVLVADGTTMRETTAIILYLAENYHTPLVPDEPKARLLYTQWLGFYNSSLHQAYGAYFLLAKNLHNVETKEEACQLVAKRMGFLWRGMEKHLADQAYICGARLSMVDILHAVIANWTTALNHKVTLGPNILRLCREVAALPYFIQALGEEGIGYDLLSEKADMTT